MGSATGAVSASGSIPDKIDPRRLGGGAAGTSIGIAGAGAGAGTGATSNTCDGVATESLGGRTKPGAGTGVDGVAASPESASMTGVGGSGEIVVIGAAAAAGRGAGAGAGVAAGTTGVEAMTTGLGATTTRVSVRAPAGGIGVLTASGGGSAVIPVMRAADIGSPRASGGSLAGSIAAIRVPRRVPSRIDGSGVNPGATFAGLDADFASAISTGEAAIVGRPSGAPFGISPSPALPTPCSAPAGRNGSPI